MKTKSEIYSIRFNKLITEKDIYCTTYTLGVPILSGSKAITPTKITLDKEGKRIITYFNDDTSHTISYSDSVEVFKRVIHVEKIQDKVK